MRSWTAERAAPDDLLVLLEAAVQEVDLHRERVARGVAIEVREVLVVGDRLVVAVDAEVLAERLASVDLPAPIIPAMPMKMLPNTSGA